MLACTESFRHASHLHTLKRPRALPTPSHVIYLHLLRLLLLYPLERFTSLYTFERPHALSTPSHVLPSHTCSAHLTEEINRRLLAGEDLQITLEEDDRNGRHQRKSGAADDAEFENDGSHGKGWNAAKSSTRGPQRSSTADAEDEDDFLQPVRPTARLLTSILNHLYSSVLWNYSVTTLSSLLCRLYCLLCTLYSLLFIL